MSERNDGGPVFPHLRSECQRVNETEMYEGISLRQYAAIKLRVPDSGVDWLDAMIERANRDHFAGQALCGLIANSEGGEPIRKANGNTCKNFAEVQEVLAGHAYGYADAMLAARKEVRP
jgi:hypothetical protein